MALNKIFQKIMKNDFRQQALCGDDFANSMHDTKIKKCFTY